MPMKKNKVKWQAIYRRSDALGSRPHSQSNTNSVLLLSVCHGTRTSFYFWYSGHHWVKRKCPHANKSPPGFPVLQQALQSASSIRLPSLTHILSRWISSLQLDTASRSFVVTRCAKHAMCQARDVPSTRRQKNSSDINPDENSLTNWKPLFLKVRLKKQ